MRHVAGRHVQARAIDVVRRIVEEDVRAECRQERPLGAPAQEQKPLYLQLEVRAVTRDRQRGAPARVTVHAPGS